MNTLIETDYQHALNVKARLKEKFGDLIYQMYCYGSRGTHHIISFLLVKTF
ncbi:MAG: hypothetical protein ACM3S2_19980 [Ignavibacteriales bacterium]